MQYKTMVLELLQQRPQLHDQLRNHRMLLSATESYAARLKSRHEAWKDQLSEASPTSDPSQIASEALEIALQELEDSLPSESLPEEDERPSLDDAIAFIRKHTPRA